MPFKNWGPGQCCCNKCITCQPCTCFTFYDPNTLEDTSDSTFPINILYSAYFLNQCASGQNAITSVGGLYTDTISGYQAGTILCQPSGINNGHSNCAPFPFDTSWCTGVPTKGCSELIVGPAIGCYGNSSGSNALMDMHVTAYTDRMDGLVTTSNNGCVPNLCVCTNDICATGHYCLPIPYCPTLINIKWDSYYADLFQKNPTITLHSGVCPVSTRDFAPYYTCDITSCQTNFTVGQKSPGECSYWLMPELAWSYTENRYVLLGGHHDVKVSAYYGGDFKLIPGPGWDALLVLEQCNIQDIDLCQENNIQITYENRGQGGFTQDGWQICQEECNCSGNVISLPAKYPTTSASISYNNTVTSYTWTGTDYVELTSTYAASLSLPLDKTTGPPGSLGCRQDTVCYQNTCVTVSNNVEVAVFGKAFGFTADFWGVGNVNLQSASVQLVGYTPNGLCIQSPGTTIPGTPCASARWMINFSPWSCNDILPANGGPRGRVACFDSDLNFTDWQDNLGPCCSCDCSDPNCSYFYGSVDGYGEQGVAYGTIDLCEGVIMIFLYDNQLNIVGTLSI